MHRKMLSKSFYVKLETSLEDDNIIERTNLTEKSKKYKASLWQKYGNVSV